MTPAGLPAGCTAYTSLTAAGFVGATILPCLSYTV